jgi:4-hydroxybenzoate polyprenyltransferase
VDPSLPKVAIYVLVAVAILAIPPLTFVALGAFLTFLGVQIVQKWAEVDPDRQVQRRYLPRAHEEEDD